MNRLPHSKFAPFSALPSSRHLFLPSTRASAAFTLMELLVVVAIIAIFASLLLPSITRAKSAAWSARCKSNLQQFSLGMALYVADFAAYPFDFGRKGDTEYHLERWPGLVRPYIESAGPLERGRPEQTVFECPSLEGTRQPTSMGPLRLSTSYGVNAFGYIDHSKILLGIAGSGQAGPVLGGVIRPTQESEIVAPARMIAFADGTANGPPGIVITSDSGPLSRTERMTLLGDFKPYIRQAQQRHKGQVNAAFCDGHIEGHRLKKLFLDYSNDGLRLWNKDHEPHGKP